MKLLAAGDLHDDHEGVRKLAEEAEKEGVDLVVINGDISNFGDLAKGMIKPFLDRNKKVAFVAGNHDVPGITEVLKEKYDILDIQNKSIIYYGVGIFGCGGANILHMNFTSDDDMFTYLSNGFRYVKAAKKKIMVTHIHPKGSMIEKFSFPGSEAVTRAIYELRPDIHICGHIHEMEGFEERMGNTRVICVGSRGKIIEV